MQARGYSKFIDNLTFGQHIEIRFQHLAVCSTISFGGSDLR